tara:strand:- start:36 stop:698 length:663 start_codon:yes stop_codon:yes gene_type:complete
MAIKHFTQKKIFLRNEGDNWFLRNKDKKNKNNFKRDKIIFGLIKNLKFKEKKRKLNFLEVGCSNGKFLLSLKKKFKNINVFGVDPSKLAIMDLKKKKIKCKVGTADELKFKKNSFDIIYYGFCLYLCDEKYYNNILRCARKILIEDGYIIIFDFFSKKLKKNIYKHDKRINSIKCDFRKIFQKKNKFNCIDHKLYNYSNMFRVKNSEKGDLLSISVLKKI